MFITVIILVSVILSILVFALGFAGMDIEIAMMIFTDIIRFAFIMVFAFIMAVAYSLRLYVPQEKENIAPDTGE